MHRLEGQDATLISSSCLALYDNEMSGNSGWFSTSSSPPTSSTFQAMYSASLPKLLPLLVRTIIPNATGQHSTPLGLTIKCVGPGAIALGLSLLSLPMRDEYQRVKLPGLHHIDVLELKPDPTSPLPLLPDDNVLDGSFPETSTKVVVVVGSSETPPSLPAGVASKVKLTTSSPPRPVTFVTSPAGNVGSYNCVFIVPKSSIDYKSVADLTLHPVSSGGSYYELRLTPTPGQALPPSLDGEQVRLCEERLDCILSSDQEILHRALSLFS